MPKQAAGTTVRLPEDLQDRVKIEAVARKTTLRQAIIDGLLLWLKTDGSLPTAEIHPKAPTPRAAGNHELLNQLFYLHQRNPALARAIEQAIRAAAREAQQDERADSAIAEASELEQQGEETLGDIETLAGIAGTNSRGPGSNPGSARRGASAVRKPGPLKQ